MSSSGASRWTIRERSRKIAVVREVISGGRSAEQLQHELSALTEKERKEILMPIEAPALITAEETLAMKADLVLPWAKMRIMRR